MKILNRNIEKLFLISSEYINNILKDEDILNELKESCEERDLKLINKSIVYVLYEKNELYINSFKIEIDIECKEKKIGFYILYLDEDENFIDEFFVIK
ncbi:hypothetical protein [Chryseobacterium vrystaatense]|uniref:Uncharacterized protein n=1 Tax=Chryseobacterium vrystaatense TaxID=307480 RepID=A0ABR4UQH1_9FLAO|nr:hypothetical protein [Chryseobacterium vrystaatense]KFF27264.1 hypothetical protein IW16_08410 [Chryseobacterium vrystaatense]